MRLEFIFPHLKISGIIVVIDNFELALLHEKNKKASVIP